MKIALIGYGKMGKEIHRMAEERGHEVVALINSSNPLNLENLNQADIAIEFTKPELAMNHIVFAIQNKLPLVVGTTGWYDNIEGVKAKVLMNEASVLYASNFSIGVNLFFELNKKLAQLMAPHTGEYKLSMEEVHHTQKLDSPSGTAITLANDIVSNSTFSSYECIEDNTAKPNLTHPAFNILARRIPDIPGTHRVQYTSDIDEITISHVAKNRRGFALGSVIAAEWLLNKKGFFTMRDVLNM